MTQPRTPEHLNDRMEAKARKPEDKLPTYQELLDHAVEDTFPASDPIAPHAATRPSKEVHTGVDDTDWKLQPADKGPPRAQHVVAEFDDEHAARDAQHQALEHEMPTARLDLPPEDQREGPAARVTVVTCTTRQRKKVEKIVREAGAAHVEVKDKPE